MANEIVLTKTITIGEINTKSNNLNATYDEKNDIVWVEDEYQNKLWFLCSKYNGDETKILSTETKPYSSVILPQLVLQFGIDMYDSDNLEPIMVDGEMMVQPSYDFLTDDLEFEKREDGTYFYSEEKLKEFEEYRKNYKKLLEEKYKSFEKKHENKKVEIDKKREEGELSNVEFGELPF